MPLHTTGRALLLAALLATLSPTVPQARQPRPMVLGISGNQFTIDGAPKFLIMFSYFGALRPTGLTISPNNIASLWPGHMSELNVHFGLLRQYGFSGIRIFANWLYTDAGQACTSVADPNSVIYRDGSINVAARDRLFQVLDLARQKELIVDLTVGIEALAPIGSVGAPSKLAYANGIRALIYDMRNNHKNVFIDIENEYNNAGCHTGNPPVPTWKPLFRGHTQAGAPSTAVTPVTDPDRLQLFVPYVKSLLGPNDAPRLITGSYTSFSGGTQCFFENNNLRHRVLMAAEANAAGFDILTVHDERCYIMSGSGLEPLWNGHAAFTAADLVTRTTKPVFFGEPERYKPTGDSSLNTPITFLSALRGAVTGGAAGWTFHTEGFFKQSQGPFGTGWGLYQTELDFLALMCSGGFNANNRVECAL